MRLARGRCNATNSQTHIPTGPGSWQPSPAGQAGSLGCNEVENVLCGAHHAHAAGALCLHGKGEHLSRHLKVGGQVGVAVAFPAVQ